MMRVECGSLTAKHSPPQERGMQKSKSFEIVRSRWLNEFVVQTDGLFVLAIDGLASMVIIKFAGERRL